MKRYDVDKIFARLVDEYIGNGYVINTRTMKGSQGEIAKVDLMKDGDFIRIYLDSGYDHKLSVDCLVLVVGRAVKPVGDGVVWNNDLEDVDRYVIYQIGKDWYSGIETYVNACKLKRVARWREGWKHVDPMENDQINLPEKCHKLILDKVRRFPRCKSVKLSDIKRITRVRREKWVEYVVVVRDNVWSLGKVALV